MHRYPYGAFIRRASNLVRDLWLTSSMGVLMLVTQFLFTSFRALVWLPALKHEQNDQDNMEIHSQMLLGKHEFLNLDSNGINYLTLTIRFFLKVKWATLLSPHSCALFAWLSILSSCVERINKMARVHRAVPIRGNAAFPALCVYSVHFRFLCCLLLLLLWRR